MYTKFLTNELTKLMEEFDYDFSHHENVEKSNNEYRLEIPIPGLSKEDIKITAMKDNITISVQKKDDKKLKFIRFDNKRYSLPKDVDINKIEAKVENGVCILILPKDKKKSEERLIEVN